MAKLPKPSFVREFRDQAVKLFRIPERYAMHTRPGFFLFHGSMAKVKTPLFPHRCERDLP